MEHIDSVLSSITPLSEDDMGNLSGGFASCKLPGHTHRPIIVNKNEKLRIDYARRVLFEKIEQEKIEIKR